jgi:hypothetical protein
MSFIELPPIGTNACHRVRPRGVPFWWYVKRTVIVYGSVIFTAVDKGTRGAPFAGEIQIAIWTSCFIGSYLSGYVRLVDMASFTIYYHCKESPFQVY